MSVAAAFWIILPAILVAIAWVDLKKMTIPDGLNLALAATGLIYQALISPDTLWVQVSAGVALLMAFWSIRRAHSKLTGRIGLGLGDVKMVGASAIWISPWNFPVFIFAASFVALIFAAGRHILDPARPANARQPFGPFLAAGLWLTWVGERQFS
jgi:leader peptidase (prepilin peptidase)/N-methyltransferase